MADVLHLGPSLEVTLQRAQRATAAGELPQAIGTAPLAWEEGAGAALLAPLPAREAVWLSIRADEPTALQVWVDGRNVVTGVDGEGPWPAEEQDHVVVPLQRWIDGVRSGPDLAEQITRPAAPDGEATLRLTARRLRGGEYAQWWRSSGEGRRANPFGSPEHFPGGDEGTREALVRQPLLPDPFGPSAWDPEPFASVVLRLIDPDRWQSATGRSLPDHPA